MTPPEAIRFLERHLATVRDPRTQDAIRLAIDALRDDVPTAMREVLDATGRTDLPLQLLRSDEGENWATWIHKGPMCTAKTPIEALRALKEKATRK